MAWTRWRWKYCDEPSDVQEREYKHQTCEIFSIVPHMVFVFDLLFSSSAESSFDEQQRLIKQNASAAAI